MKYYCHPCAIEAGLLNERALPDVLGTSYQMGKHGEHSPPSLATRPKSVFVDADPDVYRQYVASALGSGCVQVDDSGRVNVVWPANQTVGYRPRRGGSFMVVSGIKAAFPDDDTRIHAFPYGRADMPQQRCEKCGVAIPY